MKVLFDHQIFGAQNFGGISRYYYELLRSFREDGGIDAALSLYFSNNAYIRRASFSSHRTYSPKVKIGFDAIVKHFKKKNVKQSIAAIQKQDFDIFHPTYFDPYFLDHIQGKPFVLTILDMIHELYADAFSPTDTETLYKKTLAERCRKIIAISESTRQDIIRIMGIDSNKIEVIHLGSPFRVEQASCVNADGYDFPERFILFVGNRFSYKNFDGFIRAAAPVLLGDKTLYLICAGGREFTPPEKTLVKTLRIDKRVLHLPIDDHILISLYKRALCFVFPSLYEGFGIPVLEAFSCGCPVALSRTSSFPEVAGDAGAYFDPSSPESIKETIIELIESRELRTDLTRKGFERLKHFSWKTTADKTAAVYAGIMR